jgi:hypothetical protein
MSIKSSTELQDMTLKQIESCYGSPYPSKGTGAIACADSGLVQLVKYLFLLVPCQDSLQGLRFKQELPKVGLLVSWRKAWSELVLAVPNLRWEKMIYRLR